MDQLNTYDYYVMRAEHSRELAQRAASRPIAALHNELADRYDDLVAEIEASVAPALREAQAA